MSAQPIVLLSDSLEGGAAVAANRLEQGLLALDLNIERWHFSPPPPRIPKHHFSFDPHPKRPPFERLLKNLSVRAANALRHQRHTQIFINTVQRRRPALLNLHNLHNCGLNHQSLSLLPLDLPIVWTLHDGWAFQPEAFQWTQSGQPHTAAVDQPLKKARRRRDHFFAQKRRLLLVAPSRWLASTAENKLGRSVHVIPYGLDTEVFKPINPAEAQKRLNLDPSRIWIGFASTWGGSRKGTDLLKVALTGLDPEIYGFLAWGATLPDRHEFPLPIHHVGPIKQDVRLRDLYSACDLFLCPSRADNFPNTILEALACGTPIIGSRVGGLPEMVRENATGWLHEPDSAPALAAALQQAIAQRDRWVDYRQQSRGVAEKEYSLKVQAQRYADLFATPPNP